MTTTQQLRAADRVLIGFDGTDGARAAVEDLRRAGLSPKAEALVLACADVPANLPLHSVLPLEGGAIVPEPAIQAAREAAEREVQRAAAVATAGADLVAGSFPGWTVRPESVTGAPYGCLVEKARRWKADLIVLGSHGRSAVGRLFFGSVSQNVLAHAPCSVRVGRSGSSDVGRRAEEPVRILLCVDGSLDSMGAVEGVSARKWPLASEVRVVTAADTRLSLDLTMLVVTGGERHRLSPIQSLVHSVGERLRDCEVGVSTVILEGDPRKAIIKEAEHWGADCIFLGARGHSRVEKMLAGSVSSSVAARASCSVEVVRRPS
jgi:nucleotide-binding universal stress UspA family protein